MGGRPRAHPPGLLPAGRTERIVGETCVCLADARARGRTARTHARAAAGTRTRMLQAACGRPASLCGTTALKSRAAGGRTTPPAKAAHPLAAVAPGGGARPAAAAPASRAPAPARGCCIPAPSRRADGPQFGRNRSKRTPGPRLRNPGKICTAVPRERPRIDHSSQRVSGDGQKCLKKCRGRPPGQLDLGHCLKNCRGRPPGQLDLGPPREEKE